MGAYINPKGESKEVWLLREGVPLTREEFIKGDFWKELPDCLPVCLVDNVAFTAAAIGYDQEEAKRFVDPKDHRPTVFFLVEKRKLYPVSNLSQYLKP